MAAEPAQSVVVFGPTQSRKTTGFAIPAILGWKGPVVATSVKTDLVRHTIGWRQQAGEVQCFDPSRSTDLASALWSPLDEAHTWSGARKVAASLTEGAKGGNGPITDGDFWYATAAKLLAPLLLAAATGDGDMSDVVRWVDTQEESEVLDLLYAVGVREAIQAAQASFAKEDRQRSSVYTTAETVLEPFADPPVELAGREPSHIDPRLLLGECGTLYLCAPAHDQRRLRPLFTAVVRQIVEQAYETVTRTGRPLDPPLLIVLDEAANIAPLDDLDTLASTAAGHGIQLVTIWQDLAQVTARYGPRAATVVNNHRAKVFLSGISDPSTLDHASHLIGDEELHLPATTSGGQGGPTTTRSPATRRLAPPDALRRIAPGQGVLVYGGLPPARIALRSWFEDPRLAQRGDTRVGTASPDYPEVTGPVAGELLSRHRRYGRFYRQ
ncbi:MAG TPA: type IV secretory system conjugative DNA transfer family protein [Acidimicrobiales bacterium]|nr:type IV secretory system conjugative DNA transfer family protein [Acidimicrobiales bacterium]